MNMHKADYGIDAPCVVRNLFLFSLGSLVLAIISFQIENSLGFWIAFLYFFSMFLVLFGTSCWMIYGIKIAKPKIASSMIQNLHLSGNEKILDLGCGRGILLCEAAKHLPNGEAHGIDLWFNKDQSGNKPEQTLENANREEVKVMIHTGDVRALPFPDASFDVAVSNLCFHNIGEKKGREQALSEMLRILKPGGKFAIADIQYAKEYADFLIAQVAHVEYSKSDYSYCPPITIVKGKKL
jgi:SAM-dependent methyltransferase